MITRTDLQQLSKLRKTEAKVLLDAGHFSGAYYLMGYSVECALKACIAKRVRRHDFPGKDTRDIYCHDLERLLRSAELDVDYRETIAIMPALEVNWATVKDWKETVRYNPNPVAEIEARDYYKACTARRNGILTWVSTKW